MNVSDLSKIVGTKICVGIKFLAKKSQPHRLVLHFKWNRSVSIDDAFNSKSSITHTDQIWSAKLKSIS